MLWCVSAVILCAEYQSVVYKLPHSLDCPRLVVVESVVASSSNTSESRVTRIRDCSQEFPAALTAAFIQPAVFHLILQVQN